MESEPGQGCTETDRSVLVPFLMSLENLNKASHYSKYFGKFYRCDTWVILGMACSDV
jgi:hypothetical protein